MNRPTFFLLGASKAGTTSLHYYLAQHPDILMSDPKEPAFFRLEYERGPDWYWRTYFRRYAGQLRHRCRKMPSENPVIRDWMTFGSRRSLQQQGEKQDHHRARLFTSWYISSAAFTTFALAS